MEPHTIFLVGKPGSGKGTQARILGEKTGWPIVGTSGGLRELVAGGGAVGQKIHETMDSGALMPYWMASYVYMKNIFTLPPDGSVIFDGTSRTLPEAEIVLESLLWLERPFHIFHLHTRDEEVKARIELRKEKEARADDHKFDKRLEEYYALTEPAISYFRDKGVLTEVHGEGTPEDIAKEIQGILKI